MKMLIISRPNENENEEVPWDEGAIKRFKLEDHELSMLNKGKLLWRGEVAFEIEVLGE
jgi:hypothetical protein